MFANTQSEGTVLALPDVCLTPCPLPVPVPYINTATTMMAIPSVVNVFIEAAPVHTLHTLFPFSMGDTAGINGGVLSGTVMGPVRYMTGANTVLFNGSPAARLTSITLQNGFNAPGMSILPCQLKVLILAP